MPHSTISPTATSSPQLRVIRDEDTPLYDGIAPAQAMARGFTMMSNEVGETILCDLGASAFGVYWHLAKRSKNGQCWPSLDDIADATKMSRKNVTRMLDILENEGWITRTKRSNAYGMQRSTLYTLVEKPRTYACDRDGTEPGQGDVENVTRTIRKQDGEQEPKRERQKNTRSTAQKPAIEYTEAFEQFWRAYPSGRGNKFPSFKHWQRMSAADRDAAQLAIPKWKAAWGDVQFIPYCEKWLGERRWENDPPTGAKGEINWNAGGQRRTVL
jgi:DNA-binding MarR family transcriptional regulator